MFTGIIETCGRLTTMTPRQGDAVLTLDAGKLDMSDVQLGDSIAVNGVCLTVVTLGKLGFTADVSGETLANTTLGQLKPGARVNLEKALTLSSRLGGHLVSGHVDGVGQILSITPDARSIRVDVHAPEELARYIASKGSITVDGISLTVNAVTGSEFSLNIVPHTAQVTTAVQWQPGSSVNLEVDLLARYLERLLLAGHKGSGDDEKTTLTLDFLARHGFLQR